MMKMSPSNVRVFTEWDSRGWIQKFWKGGLEPATLEMGEGGRGKGDRKGNCAPKLLMKGELKQWALPVLKKHIDFKNIPVFYMYACLEMSFTVYKWPLS